MAVESGSETEEEETNTAGGWHVTEVTTGKMAAERMQQAETTQTGEKAADRMQLSETTTGDMTDDWLQLAGPTTKEAAAGETAVHGRQPVETGAD